MPQLDLALLTENLLKIIGAFVLAAPIAWEREHATRIMGLRTFPIVAVASCAYVLLAVSVIGAGEDAQARIIQGLMSGIGFLGGGAILKQDKMVHGTATAATVWATGAIGGAVGYGSYEIAITVAVINFLVLRLLTPLKVAVEEETGERSAIDA